ncbi:MAG: helix-hairpin-helix domain-containing protein [Nannocystaceae bacterium]|nr:helix-hairpin-helix domain-containing protein [Nannocystaceae bacterium]
MTGRRAAWGPLAMLVVVGALVTAGATADPPRSHVRRCADALIIDGQLVCGSQRADALARACPELHLPPPGTVLDAQCRARSGTQLMRVLALSVDINRADLEALQSLPGIGPALSRRIVAARPFEAVEDLRRVKGIGPATLKRIVSRVQVDAHPGGPSRVAAAAEVQEAP